MHLADMALHVFISYSHRDEKSLELLHKHLTMLKREGLVDVWFDRQIEAGGKINDAVDSALYRSDLFVALVSADYLASPYCYEREMEAALTRSAEGVTRVVPVILEPCDWKSSPLAQFKALPKDGMPISEWANKNLAMLDVVSELRRIISNSREERGTGTSIAMSGGGVSRRVRVKRDFDSIDRSAFRDSAYKTIRSYFEASVREINQIGEPLKASFDDITGNAFTCTIVNKAKGNSESHISLHNRKSRALGDLTYTFKPYDEENSANGVINVEADDFQLFLNWQAFAHSNEKGNKLTPEQVAQHLWDDFIERAGITYE